MTKRNSRTLKTLVDVSSLLVMRKAGNIIQHQGNQCQESECARKLYSPICSGGNKQIQGEGGEVWRGTILLNVQITLAPTLHLRVLRELVVQRLSCNFST
jgi:hypothetical protein